MPDQHEATAAPHTPQTAHAGMGGRHPYAVAPSQRTERGQPVGWDIFEVTGDLRVGDTIVLGLRFRRWVRDLSTLNEWPTQERRDA